MFGGSGCLPVDLLLETRESMTSRIPNDWVQEQWAWLRKAKQVVLEHHQDLAEQAVIDLLPLRQGTGQEHKLEPRWEACPYPKERQPFPPSPVYDIESKGQVNISASIRTWWGLTKPTADWGGYNNGHIKYGGT